MLNHHHTIYRKGYKKIGNTYANPHIQICISWKTRPSQFEYMKYAFKMHKLIKSGASIDSMCAREMLVNKMCCTSFSHVLLLLLLLMSCCCAAAAAAAISICMEFNERIVLMRRALPPF